MNINQTGFTFPKPSATAPEVSWDGSQFVDENGRGFDVLCYSQAESNWSDELTGLHEQEAGRNHPIDVASRRLALQTIRTHCVSAAPVVLEVGCSSGFFLEELNRQLPQVAIVGADYIAAPLRELATRLKSVPLLQFDLRCCPLPDASVDAVICLNVLEHIDNHESALAHIHRVLKPGGVAHIEVPAGPRLYDIYDEHLLHHRRYRMAELLQMVAKAGFNTLRATHLGFSVFPVFALKKLSNRRALRLPAEEKKRLVASQIRNTSDSGMLRMALRMEMALGRWLSFPFGIRCVVVVQKPGCAPSVF